MFRPAKLLWAIAIVGSAIPLMAVAQPTTPAKGSKTLPLYGYDFTTAKKIPVPKATSDDVNLVYNIFDKRWEVPTIDTKLDGNIVAFYRQRDPADQNMTAAAFENQLPYRALTTNLGHQGACRTPLLTTSGWCTAQNFSFSFNADKMNEWTAKILVSHEFIHGKQRDLLGRTAQDAMPHWMREGMGNGFGFGLMENLPGYSQEALAKRLSPRPGSMATFFLGLRFYDHALDVDSIASSYPRDHLGYPADPKAPGDHIEMAGYMSGSFFRHILRGKPGGLETVKHLLAQRPPSGGGNDAWLDWLDDGLRNDPNKSWPGGIRQVYSTMIVELADMPDLIAKSRAGKLSAPIYDQYLWSDGCTVIDLTVKKEWKGTVPVRGLASRCLRVKLPPDGLDMSGVDAKIAGPVIPPAFTVTAESLTGGCEDLELGSAGAMVKNPKLFFATGNPRNCSTKWQGFYLPKNIKDPNGLKGWQTVVLMNVPSRPVGARAQVLQLTVARPKVEAAVDAQAVVKDPVTGIKKKSPAPRPGPKPIPAPLEPLIVERPEATECDAETVAMLECGNEISLALGYGEVTELTAQSNMFAGVLGHMYPEGEFTRTDYVSPGKAIQDALFAKNGGLNDVMTRVAASGRAPEGASIKLIMPPLAKGQTGSFPARVNMEWTDYETMMPFRLSSLAADRTANSNGCVVVMGKVSDATVNITMNGHGGLVGTVMANLYQDNPDAEDACRTPMLKGGTLKMSFATPGVIFIGDGDDYRFDTDDMVARMAEESSFPSQILIPFSQRSDHLTSWPDGIPHEAVTTGGPASMVQGKCDPGKITRKDMIGFIRAISDGDDLGGVSDDMLLSSLGMGADMLRPMACPWIAAGRPVKWQMREEPDLPDED